MRTSTLSMPTPWAQAMPPTTTVPASVSDSGLGVSMRLEILIGASTTQSRSVQYACSASYVVSVMRVIHLHALTKP